MLDADTKAKIDSARDILVGKVPDPKSQVEQITIALIYKFMDDMDRQSEELGGKATFFTGDFKKYRWAQLLDKRLSGHERLLLYAEGIEKMNVNKNTPQLFRDIFKGVFLPYRDPETLNLFLKEIDGFTYEHSERLGDAFEYLLSVLGTQGDAGQFRTPRHIIDFIVAVVDPKKNETVLDPACGTAGFLISAYKHILKANDNLSPDERARLMTNFRGYDIAPDMVRLSRVNLYLHGFPNPVIHEYDALSSEERWDERCDVILANPPFMTPKGGIRPHNRFSIKAQRSEVLFVDYIAEHLNPSGRAGIIVPESIIFQSQNAYNALRKMMVENYLWAVVSLPAGMFNPYSGVKTSILFLDRNLAKRTDDVLFVKIENDGFGLGAQRRPVEGSDLPGALKGLLEWRTVAGAAGPGPASPRPATTKTLAVSRKRLLESPNIILSSDRYRVAAVRHGGKWPIVKLGEVCKLEKGASFTRAQARAGNVPVIAGGQVPSCYHAEANRQPPVITVSASGAYAGFVNYFEVPIFASDCTTIVSLNEQRAKTRFIFEILEGRQEAIYETQKGMAQPHVYAKDLIALETPLPPLDEQERIVAELEGYRKIIEGARQILASYKPTIRIDPEWPRVELGQYLRINNGGVLTEFQKGGNVACVKVSDMNLPENQWEIRTSSHWTNNPPHAIVPKGSVIFPKRGAAIATNKKRFTIIPCLVDNNCMALIVTRSAELDSRYLFYFLLGFDLSTISNSAGVALINNGDINSVEIPLPHIDVQCGIVAELDSERKLVDANRELIARMEAKIQAKLAEVWGEGSSQHHNT